MSSAPVLSSADGLVGMLALILLVGAVLLAGVVWFAVSLTRREAARAPHRMTDQDEARLASRYAHGEIDANEYWRAIDTLRGRRS